MPEDITSTNALGIPSKSDVKTNTAAFLMNSDIEEPLLDKRQR